MLLTRKLYHLSWGLLLLITTLASQPMAVKAEVEPDVSALGTRALLLLQQPQSERQATSLASEIARKKLLGGGNFEQLVAMLLTWENRQHAFGELFLLAEGRLGFFTTLLGGPYRAVNETEHDAALTLLRQLIQDGKNQRDWLNVPNDFCQRAVANPNLARAILGRPLAETEDCWATVRTAAQKEYQAGEKSARPIDLALARQLLLSDTAQKDALHTKIIEHNLLGGGAFQEAVLLLTTKQTEAGLRALFTLAEMRPTKSDVWLARFNSIPLETDHDAALAFLKILIELEARGLPALTPFAEKFERAAANQNLWLTIAKRPLDPARDAWQWALLKELDNNQVAIELRRSVIEQLAVSGRLSFIEGTAPRLLMAMLPADESGLLQFSERVHWQAYIARRLGRLRRLSTRGQRRLIELAFDESDTTAANALWGLERHPPNSIEERKSLLLMLRLANSRPYDELNKRGLADFLLDQLQHRQRKYPLSADEDTASARFLTRSALIGHRDQAKRAASLIRFSPYNIDQQQLAAFPLRAFPTSLTNEERVARILAIGPKDDSVIEKTVAVIEREPALHALGLQKIMKIPRSSAKQRGNLLRLVTYANHMTTEELERCLLPAFLLKTLKQVTRRYQPTASENLQIARFLTATALTGSEANATQAATLLRVGDYPIDQELLTGIRPQAFPASLDAPQLIQRIVALGHTKRPVREKLIQLAKGQEGPLVIAALAAIDKQDWTFDPSAQLQMIFAGRTIEAKRHALGKLQEAVHLLPAKEAIQLIDHFLRIDGELPIDIFPLTMSVCTLSGAAEMHLLQTLAGRRPDQAEADDTIRWRATTFLFHAAHPEISNRMEIIDGLADLLSEETERAQWARTILAKWSVSEPWQTNRGRIVLVLGRRQMRMASPYRMHGKYSVERRGPFTPEVRRYLRNTIILTAMVLLPDLPEADDPTVFIAQYNLQLQLTAALAERLDYDNFVALSDNQVNDPFGERSRKDTKHPAEIAHAKLAYLANAYVQLLKVDNAVPYYLRDAFFPLSFQAETDLNSARELKPWRSK